MQVYTIITIYEIIYTMGVGHLKVWINLSYLDSIV